MDRVFDRRSLYPQVLIAVFMMCNSTAMLLQARRTIRHGWLPLCLIILDAALLWFDLLATWITDRYPEPVIVTGWIMAGLTAIAAIVLGHFVAQAPGQPDRQFATTN